MTTVKSFHTNTFRRITKYASSLDPQVIALIYKTRAITLMPTDIELQTTLDNMDSHIPQILDNLGYQPLNRNNKAKFIQSMLNLASKFSGLTFINAVKALQIKYDLPDDETKNIVNAVIGVLQSEGLIPFYSFP